MSTNKRGEIIARTIEAMKALHESIDPLATRIEALRGLEIDDNTRQDIEDGLAKFRSNLDEARTTIDEIATEDRVTGAVLLAGLEQITSKLAAIELPPRPEDVLDPIEQAREVIDGAMSSAFRSIDEIMRGILPTFYESMSREYRDRTDREGQTEIVGLKIHLPREIDNDPRGVAVSVEVVHLASIDNRQMYELMESDEHAAELANHFDGQAIALVQHGTGRPVDQPDIEPVDAFIVTVVHPTGIEAHLQTRTSPSSEWQTEEMRERIGITDEEDRRKIAEGEFGALPSGLARFYANYLHAITQKH